LIVAASTRIINPYASMFCQPVMSQDSAKHLVIAHYHLRPGGVRRVIETALPALVEDGAVDGVTLATGEPPEEGWLQRLQRAIGDVPLTVAVQERFLYRSEWEGGHDDELLPKFCTALLERCGGPRVVLWAHNLALGRNVPLAAAWEQAARETGAVFLSHHHDFFFDNRWIRWPEMVRSGVPDLAAAARVVFPSGERVVHLAINRADHALLATGFGAGARWLPNPVATPRHEAGGREAARRWLAQTTGSTAPYWLLPCRLLRRKNVAEAVLLVRWLRPGARLVTTGGTTSSDEESYRGRLVEAAGSGGWPLDLSVLAGAGDTLPVSALIAGAEAVVLTSLQEGFGLPYLEAAASRRPMVARALQNVLPDLLVLGLRVPTAYDELIVPTDWFDVGRERRRQRDLLEQWRAVLPDEARALAGEPWLLAKAGDTVPFNRLTLTAQEEVLARRPQDLGGDLAALNPLLAPWQGRGEDLPEAGFAAGGEDALSPTRFAAGFWSAVQEAGRNDPPAGADASWLVLRAFLAERLRGDNIYPLLLAPRT